MTNHPTGPNVLITAAAAKVLLVQTFRDALGGCGKIFTADRSVDCAAASLSDGHFVVEPTAQLDTLDHILSLCRTHDIGLVVPTRDGDLPVFAESRGRFRDAGIFVLVAAPETIRLCQDKSAFTNFLVENGLPPVPLVERPGPDMAFPAFVRPISGAGGHGARRIDSWKEYVALEKKERYLLHPFIDAPECTIDLLMDLDGSRALDAVCRERIQVVGGESKISRVADLPELSALICRMGETLALVGHNTVQAFLDTVRGPLIVEVNARFGGASNLSIRAGLDSPRRILQMLKGDETARAPRKIAYGATMFRYSQDVMVGIE